jgi:diadenylate cyclase
MVAKLTSFFRTAWCSIVNAFQQISAWDVIDILLVSVLIYYLFCFLRMRRAGKLVGGILVLVGIRAVGALLELKSILFIMDHILEVGLIALIVLFQPEVRSVLEKVGGTPIRGAKVNAANRNENAITALCTACCTLAKDKIGALIVIERRTRLGEITDSGTLLDADLSAPLLCNIFQNKAPLHDGAVVIRAGRVMAAGCFLPLSTNQEIIKDLGTRHRAGIGMTENSDAIVLIVSEETGTISVACNGSLTRNYDYISLARELARLFGETKKEGEDVSKSGWQKFCNRIKNFFTRDIFSDPMENTEGDREEDGTMIVHRSRGFYWFARIASLLLSIALWVYATNAC